MPGIKASVKLNPDGTVNPPNLFLTTTSFMMPVWLTVKSLSGGEISPDTGLVAEAYSRVAIACETPSCLAIAAMEHPLFLGLSKNLFAACIEAMNRVKRAASVLLLREDSRMVKALEVTGAITSEMRARILGASPVGRASPSTVNGYVRIVAYTAVPLGRTLFTRAEYLWGVPPTVYRSREKLISHHIPDTLSTTTWF